MFPPTKSKAPSLIHHTNEDEMGLPTSIIASVLMHFTEILKGVGHLAHVGGLVCGYLLAKFTIPRAPEFFFTEDGIIEMRQDHGQP